MPSILPLPLLPGPDDPRERIDSLLRSIDRLAAFRPAAVVCLTGPGDRATVVDGLRELAAEAERVGAAPRARAVPGGGNREAGRSSTRSAEAVELIDEVGSPAIGIQFDVWHLWNTPGLYDEIERHAHRSSAST